MARKRASSTQMQEAAAAAAAAAVVASQDESGLDDIEAAEISEDVLEGLRRLDQGGNRVTWYVYSDTPGKSGDSEGYIEKLRTEHLDEQRFKARYGPGEYRVLGRTGDGHYVRGSHKVIKISDIGAEPTATRAPETDALGLMREMRAQDEARQKSRDESMKSYATILAAPLATLGAALIARRPAIDIAALVTALRPQQNTPTLADMTTALVNLKAVQGDGGGGNVELVLKVLERLQDLPQGGGTSEGGWLGFLRDVVKEAAPHARELLAQRLPPGQLPAGSISGPAFGPGIAPALPRAPTGSNGGSAPPPIVSGPLPSSQSSAASNDTPKPSEGNDMLAIAEPWLRRRAEDLHEWAASNMDVELCSEMLLASVPKPFRAYLTAADLIGYLQRPDWWAVLTAFHPPLTPYQAWIDDARQELIQLLADELNEHGSSPEPSAPDRGTTQ